jgi:hypothetical protein
MLSSALMGPVIRFIGFLDGFLLAGLVNFLVIGLCHFLLKDFLPQPVASGNE